MSQASTAVLPMADRNDLSALKKAKNEEKKKHKAEKFEKKKSQNLGAEASSQPKASHVTLEKICYAGNTAPGEKKDTECPLPEKYSSSYVEAAWYSWWEKQGFFRPEYKHTMEELEKMPADRKFIILIPPPNVTGSLHIGHALMCSLEDALSRWHRMHGKAVLWNPGCDHAGIATQVVVEKKLKRDRGLSRHDIGREKFVEEVWKWKEEKGVRIYEQMKRLGISADWSREYFTMDGPRNKAVVESFVRLYEKNMIYRAKRLVNWSCSLKSAISDIEVEKLEITGRKLLSIPGYTEKVEFGLIVDFSYRFSNSDETITISTTRVETMLGDVAVAVHPEDVRYKGLIGKTLVHPFCERTLVIIADSSVDKNFGTGAVKVTPAHDANDYEIGLKHNLKMISIFDEDGCIVTDLDFKENYKHFGGMKRFHARKAVLEALKELKLFAKIAEHSLAIPICSRSKDIIEPILKSQWYVRCSDMAARAIEAVRGGDLKVIPSHHEKTWFYWMENIRDWCISRQLWWGHRVPAYLVSSTDSSLLETDSEDPNFWICARTKEEALQLASKRFHIDAAKISLTEDEDVLDTWFSSGLLPFSVFDWPTKTVQYNAMYPTTLLETGYDILFFWVARMVMLSQELTGVLPFKEVFLHSIVRDAHGRKMSKSLGNIIDPVDVIEGISLENLLKQLETYNLDPLEVERAAKGQCKDFPMGIPECGSDALRFTLCAYTGSIKDINLDVYRVQGYRFFCNKIWNAVRFCLIYFKNRFVPSDKFPIGTESAMDLWILSRLSLAESVANDSFAKYDFPSVTTAVYNFWLYDLCDIYIESRKPVFSGGDAEEANTSKQVLFNCIDHGLRLLHPFMPFITEELYQRLPFPRFHLCDIPSICVSPYPSKLPWRNLAIEKDIETVMSTVRIVRSVKDDYVPTKAKVEVFLHSKDVTTRSLFQSHKLMIQTLCNASRVVVETELPDIPAGCAVATNGSICSIYILLKGVIDVSKEIFKTEVKIQKVRESLAKLEESMRIPEYSDKVPSSVQEANSLKEAQYKDEISHLEKIMDCLKIAE